MQVLVLGAVRIERDGDELSVGPRLQRLLAALVARRGEMVSDETLAEIVWEGAPPPRAEATLRTYVTRLRNALGADREALQFRHAGYVLDLDDDQVDAECFDDEVEDGLLALRTADLPRADELLSTALRRWSGRPYGAFADEEWARPECVRLEERRAEAREALIEVALAEGRSDAAVADAQGLAEEYPLRERPRELLMRALYRAGRRAEALRVYGRYRSYLIEETGLDPSDELRQLEHKMLAGEMPTSPTVGRARSYELAELIGRGAFSVVHRGVQPGIGREVAVKILRSEIADQPDFVRRFENEARLAAAIEHPFVVPLYDFWREPGTAYLVMRLMRGGNLAELLRDRGPLSREQMCRVLDEVGGALTAAHRAGVVHGDVRPANLLRDEDGVTYLADFGLAIAECAGVNERAIHYAAPELLRGEEVDATADVLSLGVTAFELLTGRLPLGETTDRAELVRRQLDEPLPSVHSTRPDLPSHVDDVLHRATSRARSDRYQSVLEFVGDLTSELAGRPATPRTVASPTPVDNPYVGLHAFGEADADRFHGREHLIGELADAVERNRLTVVVGPSGSGKSSVVRAGLIPAIRSGAVPGSADWFVTTTVPGDDPIAALEAALLRVAVNPPASLREQLAEDGGLLRAVRRVLPHDDATVLVVIDQFEELFTMVRSDALRTRFLDELAHAIEAPASPLRVVATLRADHYDAPLANPAFAQLVTDGTVTVRPMRPEELEQAVVAPARAVGVEVESSLVADLVAGVSDRPSALPLLQFALTELFERRVADVMLLETHQVLGGLTGALAARAERILERGDDHDHDLVRRIFARLIMVGDDADRDARRRAPVAEFGDDERTAWLIDEYVTARLLVVDRDDETREPTVEVAHEALLRDWPRLAGWIDDDRADLRVHRIVTTATAEWNDAGRDEGMLARGGRLELVDDLAGRRPELLNDVEHDWVERSRAITAAELDHERRSRRRMRSALVTTAVLLVVAVSAAAFALVLGERARDNQRVAEARELTLEAEKAIADDPELGLLLGLEAADAYRASGDDIPTAVLQSMRDGIASTRVEARLDGTGWAAASPDGALLATGTEAGGAIVYRVDTTDVVREWELDEGTIGRGRFAGSDLLVLVESDIGTFSLVLLDPASDGVETVADDVDPGEWSEALPDLGLAARVLSGNEVEVVRLHDGEVITSFPTTLSDSLPTLTDDGLLVFPQGDDASSRIVIADLTSGDERVVATEFLPQVGALSPDRRLVAVARQSGDVAVYDVESAELRWRAPELNRAATPVWSPDGRLLASGGEAGLTIFDARDGRILDAFEPHRGITWWYDFLGGSDFIAAASQGEGAIAIARASSAPEIGEPVRLGLARPGWAVTALPSGQVLVSDGQSVSVVRDGFERALVEGVHDDGTSDFAWTTPRASASGRFSVDVGRSHLYESGDVEAVWEAPQQWSIRGISADGSNVVVHRTADGVGETRAVRLDDGSETVLSGAGQFAEASLSPEGRFIVTTDTFSGSMTLFGSDGVELHRFGSEVSGLHPTFLPDGSTMVVGTYDGNVIGFDLASLAPGAPSEEAEVFRIDAHDTLILSVNVSPDGSMIATTPQSEPARVWDIATGDLIAEFDGNGLNVGIAFHPTEPWVYVVRDGMLTIHTLDDDELLEVARGRVVRDLTDAECRRYLRRACDG